jgi:hypothetical protein
MLLVQTVLTLMTGLWCRPAAAPLTDWLASAWANTDPPIARRTTDQEQSRKVIIRLEDNPACDQTRTDKKTCRVIVKSIGSDEGRQACRGPCGRLPTRICGPMGVDRACDASKCVKIVARIRSDGFSDGPESCEARNNFWIRLDDEDRSASGPEKGKFFGVFNVADAAAEAGGPWLGVQFGPVSKALASQLGLDKGIGQMVLNVIEDSPADKAGLQQYDVIVRIDKKDAPAKIEDFMDIVKGFEPGETHKLGLIRGARPVETTVTIGTRPEEVGPAKYKYESELEELTQNDMLQRGGILRQTPDGKWIIERFGDLKGMPDMRSLDHLFGWAGRLPGSPFDVDVQTEKGDLRIEGRDGKFTVTRTRTEAGDKKVTTTRTFESEQDLKKGDPEAYKVLKEHVKVGVGVFGDKGAKVFVGPGTEGFKGFPNGTQIEKKFHEALKDAEAAGQKALEAEAKARKSVAREMEKYREAHGGDLFASRRARTSFEVASDGKIRVTTRKGSEELTRTFDNAEALKQARPDLYEKYQKLNERPGDAEPGD